MYMRSLPGYTLADLAEEYDEHLNTWGGVTQQITPHLEEDERFVQCGAHEIFVNEDSLASLATFFDIPPKFFKRLAPDQQQFLLRTQIERADKEVSVFHNNDGLKEIRRAGEVRVRPHKLVEGLMRSFPGESPIVDSWNDADELRIDVIMPENFERGTGGDPKVNDITRGGLRITQDRKHNSAPGIEKLLYRLVCTNGMEVPAPDLRVDARGANEMEIYALFEAEVARAVDSLEQEIEAFYELRNERLGEDPTGILHRLATEQNLPVRTASALEDLVPTLLREEADGQVSMFDVVNLMTNQANNPSLDIRSSSRRNLQRAGGNLVSDHMERCGTCHSRLGR